MVKSRTTAGNDASISVISKELIDLIGYGTSDLDCIKITVESTNAHYRFEITLMHEDWSNGRFKEWIYCTKTYPLNSAKTIKDFIEENVYPVFKDVDSFKVFVDENGKLEK